MLNYNSYQSEVKQMTDKLYKKEQFIYLWWTHSVQRQNWLKNEFFFKVQNSELSIRRLWSSSPNFWRRYSRKLLASSQTKLEWGKPKNFGVSLDHFGNHLLLFKLLDSCFGSVCSLSTSACLLFALFLLWICYVR